MESGFVFGMILSMGKPLLDLLLVWSKIRVKNTYLANCYLIRNGLLNPYVIQINDFELHPMIFIRIFLLHLNCNLMY